MKKIETLPEFLRLLAKARTEYGYEFKFETGINIVPVQDPKPRFAHVYTKAVTYRNLQLDVRRMYPVEVVWHCFFRKEGEEEVHIPGPSVAAKAIGLNRERLMKLMAAGEDFHNHDVKLRRFLLKAAGLVEVSKTARGSPEEEMRFDAYAKVAKAVVRRKWDDESRKSTPQKKRPGADLGRKEHGRSKVHSSRVPVARRPPKH